MWINLSHKPTSSFCGWCTPGPTNGQMCCPQPDPPVLSKLLLTSCSCKLMCSPFTETWLVFLYTVVMVLFLSKWSGYHNNRTSLIFFIVLALLTLKLDVYWQLSHISSETEQNSRQMWQHTTHWAKNPPYVRNNLTFHFVFNLNTL